MKIKFSQSPEDFITNAKEALARRDGNLTGDERSGQFNISTPVGSVKGNYTIEGQFMHVNITKKPFFVSESMIEDAIQKFLGS